MLRFSSWILVALSYGCAPAEEDASMAIISGQVEFQLADEVMGGSVATWSAFGYNRDGKALLYLSSAEGATCEDVSSYLGKDSGSFDPSPLFESHSCNLSLKVGSYSGEEISLQDDRLAATWSMECTLGEGEFNWEQRDRPGYYWSGSRWQGMPEEWSITLSGGDGEPLLLAASMDSYEGGFPSDFDNLDVDGEGPVSGSTEATWCTGLANATIF